MTRLIQRSSMKYPHLPTLDYSNKKQAYIVVFNHNPVLSSKKCDSVEPVCAQKLLLQVVSNYCTVKLLTTTLKAIGRNNGSREWSDIMQIITGAYIANVL